jgi:hypothetical protein
MELFFLSLALSEFPKPGSAFPELHFKFAEKLKLTN